MNVFCHPISFDLVIFTTNLILDLMKKLFLFHLVTLFTAIQVSMAQQFRVEDTWPTIRFQFPVDVQYPPDNTNRLMVVQQNGIIRVMKDSLGATTSSVFLNIANRISFNQNGETGLLGLAFHPDFANNGFFYVNYTRASPLRTIVSRFKVMDNNPNRADSLSEKEILSIPQPFSNHNAGALLFGNDGYLYITTGDGGSGNDPQNHGQSLNSLLGKILRIDVNTPDSIPYAIPPDNPFVNDPAARDEIYAYGLRNPWKMTIDRDKGTIWIADVGQNAREEIDTLVRGANYGWKVVEGTICTPGVSPSNCDKSGFEPPVLDYVNPSVGRSITGGFVYKGTEMPMLKNKYIFGDYVSRMVWYLQPNADGTAYTMQTLVNADVNISSFAQNKAGEVFAVAHSGPNGRLLRLRCGDAQRPVISGASVQTICNGQSVLLQAPPALGYLWSTGDTTQSITVSTSGAYTLRTRNNSGCYTDPSDVVQVVQQVLPPLEITFSGPDGTPCLGDTVTLIASAGYDSYTWSNQAVGNAIQVTQPGTYTVTGNLQGCLSQPTSINVEFNPLPPTPELSLSGNQLIATMVPNGVYTWIVNGQVQAGVSSNVFTLPCTDCDLNITVRVFANGCLSLPSVPLVITDLLNPLNVGKMNLYPNPAKDVLNIEFPVDMGAKVQAQITDMSGKLVKSYTSVKVSNGKAEIKLHSISAGSYRIALSANGKTISGSFVKK
jgi:glucose/arabinose dehydrogenase